MVPVLPFLELPCGHCYLLAFWCICFLREIETSWWLETLVLTLVPSIPTTLIEYLGPSCQPWGPKSWWQQAENLGSLPGVQHSLATSSGTVARKWGTCIFHHLHHLWIRGRKVGAGFQKSGFISHILDLTSRSKVQCNQYELNTLGVLRREEIINENLVKQNLSST